MFVLKKDKKRRIVSDQPRVVMVLVRRNLEKKKGKGVPLVDQDD